MLQGKRVTKETYKQTNRKIIPLKSEEIKKKKHVHMLYVYYFYIRMK